MTTPARRAVRNARHLVSGRVFARRYGLAAGVAASGVAAWLTASSGVLLVRDVEVLLWAVAAGMAIRVAVLAARLQADWNVRALQVVVAPLLVIGAGWAGYVVLEPFHRVAASASLAAAMLLLAGVARTSPADVRPIGAAQRLTGES